MPRKRLTGAALRAENLSDRIDRAAHALMDKFDESLTQINRRSVQVKRHVILPDKGSQDEISTRYEADDLVDLEAMDKLAGTLKTIRQSAAMKLPGEEGDVQPLTLLCLSDAEKEAYCR